LATREPGPDIDLDASTLPPVKRRPDRPTPQHGAPLSSAAAPEPGATARPAPGTIIGDGFEIIRFLAEGGMGQVHVARDLKLGRLVAVKLVHLRGPSVERALALFEREARATAKLHHANIVTVYQFGSWHGLPFLVLELMEGAPLSVVLRRRSLSVREVLSIGIQTSRALVHAHRAGLVHRDLKLGNIFRLDDGTVKVLDFGLSISPDDSLEVTDDAAAGTPGYMPPEQARGETQDERVDVWALGAVLFRLLTQRLPFSSSGVLDASLVAPGVAELQPSVPGAVDALVQRALAKDPDARFQSAREMLDALLAIERDAARRPDGEPYRYLEPFSESDAGWFFGRDRETARLVSLIADRPLVAVIGPSGAGKSSLVHAGLVPALREAERPWTVLSVSPGRKPMATLHAALALATDGALGAHGPEALLSSPGLVGQAVRELAHRSDGNVLLVVDQLEELYTQGADQATRAGFTDALLSAADDPDSGVTVIIAIRSDFIHRCTETPTFGERVTANLLALGAPGRAAMIGALQEPAARLGYEFEEGLAEQMVAELEGVAAPLPLLQFAMSRLWEYRDRDDRCVQRKALDRLGGVAGVLATHAEHVFAELPAREDQALARSILCAMVTPDGTRQAVKRVSLTGGFADPARADRVLQHLLDGRLLTATRGEEAAASVRIAHESLITTWNRLRRWLGDSEAERRLGARISNAAAHWQERGRPAQLLWTDAALDEALRWRSGSAAVTGDAIAAFLDDGVRSATRRRRRRLALLIGSAVLLIAISLGSYAAMLVFRDRGMRAQEAEAHARQSQLRAEAGQRQRVIQSLGVRAESARLRDHRSEAVALLRAAIALQGEDRGSQQPTEMALSVEHLSSLGGLAFVLPGHSVVDDVLFSPDGGRVATVGGDRVILWDAATGERLHTLTGHKGRVLAMAFGPDDKWLATGAINDPSVRVWAADGTLARSLEGPGNMVRTVVANADRTMLASTHEFAVRLWDPLTGRLLSELGPHPSRVKPIAFSPDGQTVATGTHAGVIGIWSVASGAQRHRLEAHTDKAYSLAYSPDSSLLACASFDTTVTVWRVADGGLVHRLPHDGPLWRVAFSPDGRHIAASSDLKTTRIWSTSDGSAARTLAGHELGIFDVGFTTDGRSIVSASFDHTAIVWDRRTGDRTRTLAGHTDRLWELDISPTGDRVATASDDGTARLWDLTDAHGVQMLHGAGPIAAVAVAPDGSRLAGAYSTSGFRVWDAGGQLERTLGTPTLRGREIRFDEAGRRVATVGTSTVLPIWDAATGRLLRELSHPRPVRNVAFHPDGRQIATVTTEAQLFLWSDDAGLEPRKLEVPYRGGGPLVYTHSGRSLLSFNFIETYIVVHDTETAETRHVLKAHEPHVTALSRSPAQEAFVSGGADGRARIWNADTGTIVHELVGNSAVVDLRYSPDGAKVAAAYEDGLGRLFDTETGRELRHLAGHTGAMRGIAWLQGGAAVVSAGNDSTVRFWDATNGRQTHAIKGPADPYRLLTRPNARQVVVAGQSGELWIWSDPTGTGAAENAGARTNLRVCRDSLSLVPVTPFPPADTVWAPESACRVKDAGRAP